jgi:hypothetical protein
MYTDVCMFFSVLSFFFIVRNVSAQVVLKSLCFYSNFLMFSVIKFCGLKGMSRNDGGRSNNILSAEAITSVSVLSVVGHVKEP